MRGRSAILKSTACLIVFLLTLSGASVALTAAPALSGHGAHPDASPGTAHPFAWTEELSVPALEDEARRVAEALDIRHVPTPDSFDRYATSGDDDRRIAWRAYLLRVMADHVSGEDDTALGDQDVAQVADDGAPSPHGLRGLWSLELHGRPRQLLSAGEGAGVFLVTQYGVIRFTEPGAPPVWMTKPGSVHSAEAVDVDGDGGLDLVLHVSAYRFGGDAPSVVVVDGDTGAVLFSGFAGDERFIRLAVSDVDGDGTPDVLGWTEGGLFRAARLDGTVIHESVLPEGETQMQNALLFWVLIFQLPSLVSGFGDVDGDGAIDMVVSGWSRVRAILYVVQVSVGTDDVRVYSGRDGSEIWSASVPNLALFSVLFPYIAGDMDVDGREEVVFYHFSIGFTGFLVYAITVESGVIGLSGADGRLLFDDRRQYAFVILLLVARTVSIKEGAGYEPIGIADLDGDGTAELVVLGGDGGAIAIQGRFPRRPAARPEWCGSVRWRSLQSGTI